MRFKFFTVPFLIILLLCGCKHCRKDPSCDGDILISEISNKSDYDCPLLIENDRNAIIFLNGLQVEFSGQLIELTEAGYYEMVIVYPDRRDTIRFNLLDSERGTSEWGLKKWIPAEYNFAELTNEIIEVIHPKFYVGTINIPFLFKSTEAGVKSKLYAKGIVNPSGEQFSIYKGVGSVSISSFNLDHVNFTLGGREINSVISPNTSLSIKLSDPIITSLEIPANSVIEITSDLHIENTGSLLINDGCLVLLGNGVNIYNLGPVTIRGTSDNPVLFTCISPEQFWGGFISDGSASSIVAENTFFCQSGNNTGGSFSYGHAKRQALFKSSNSSLQLTTCYILDNIGQIFYPENSILKLDNIIVNRAKTGGQLNWSQANISNSVFAEFPEVTQDFQDDDNDGLYIIGSNVTIKNSVFMLTKDDGLDSGGDAGGQVTVSNCCFESCFHEGAALSSSDPATKLHTFVNCTFSNCQQGLELGYSSSEHQVVADSCIFRDNHVGIRYGDNYEWPTNGKILIKNSFSIFNDRDVWNLVHETWLPKKNNMHFVNTKVTIPVSIYPELIVYE